MAISTSTVFEVRTTGSDTLCSGGFVTGATGTDYSQQDSAQYTGTDLVIDGTTNTKVTSASHNFVAADVGNLIQITAGTGFTTGFFQIVSVASNAATLDRSAGTLSSTGGTYAVGGALASPGKASGAMVGGNVLWIRAGTYTVTSATANVAGGIVSLPGAADANRPTMMRGYTSARYGTGAKPEIYCPSSLLAFGVAIVTMAAHGVAVGVKVRSTASAPSVHCWNTTNAVLVGCEASNCNYNGFTGSGKCLGCYATNTGRAGADGFTGFTCIRCVSDGSGLNGFSLGDCVECIATRGVVGFNVSNFGMALTRCVAYGCSSHGFAFAVPGYGSKILAGCVAVGCGGYGFQDPRWDILSDCAAWNNTSGNLPTGTSGEFQFGSVFIGASAAPVTTSTLTGDPFTNAAGNDFTLNTTAGAGGALRNVSWTFPGISLASFDDVGAVQSQAAGGGLLLPRTMDGGYAE